MEPVLKPYKKDFAHSYAFGAFPTIELIKARPDRVLRVLTASAYRPQGMDDLEALCAERGIPLEINDRAVSRLSPKESCLVIGVFEKYECALEKASPHVALVSPGNMGNLGTIVRTMLGFGVRDLALIGGGADPLDPKAVRASMGALFRIRFARFETIGDYRALYSGHALYPFMLGGELTLQSLPPKSGAPFTLLFGNEATGLDESYRSVGQSVVIGHSGEIDSLNLSIAAGIALYEFTKK